MTNSKSVYRGTKSPVSVSDENVEGKQNRVYFSICIFCLPQKIASLLQINIFIEMESILKV